MRHWIALTALLGSILVACGSGPHLEVPARGDENYSELHPVAIHAVSPHEIFVTGSLLRNDGTPEGLILASETGGRNWRRLAVEVHDLARLTFQDIFFNDRLRGWVAGLRVDQLGRTRPVVFRTADGGNHWREVALPIDPNVLITEIHSLVFSSDSEGVVAVRVADPVSGAESETSFETVDAGRSWTTATLRGEPRQPFYEQNRAFIDAKRGFRLTRTPYPGVTMVEMTGSGGEDWMPVSELSIAALRTY